VQSANIFRTLPPTGDDFNQEEDEPALEPAWPHLQVVYELLLRFTVSPHVKSKPAKKFLTQKFCLQLIELFDAEDPRERDYLKTILHRVYGKIMSLRSFIRRAIANVFFRFVFETHNHNGVGELLEILGSIINGFALPLKPEHLVFLERALIPLHKPRGVAAYHQQLSYCVTQYVEKDPATSVPIILGMLKCWPWTNSSKQVLFLNELEEILELVPHESIDAAFKPLFRVIGKCIASQHFQVGESLQERWESDSLLWARSREVFVLVELGHAAGLGGAVQGVRAAVSPPHLGGPRPGSDDALEPDSVFSCSERDQTLRGYRRGPGQAVCKTSSGGRRSQGQRESRPRTTMGRVGSDAGRRRTRCRDRPNSRQHSGWSSASNGSSGGGRCLGKRLNALACNNHCLHTHARNQLRQHEPMASWGLPTVQTSRDC
jgi:hypothetical protein